VLGITYNGNTGTTRARNWNMQMLRLKFQPEEEYVKTTSKMFKF
jgi:hypothetical protein